MNNIIVFAALSLTAIVSTQALADRSNGIKFRDLEYQQPRDPLLPSNQSADIVEHTPRAWLSTASAALNAAIPAGTSRAEAETILHKAGATCRPAIGASERCTYFDVKTRDPYIDAVHWNIRLDLADDRVNSLSVDRSWTRD